MNGLPFTHTYTSNSKNHTMTEERLENIETKISFQEDLLEELNKTVYQQQQKIEPKSGSYPAPIANN